MQEKRKKGKVGRVSETHSSMTRMNFWSFGQKNLTSTLIPIYNTIPCILLAPPLQVLHPELLYSTQQLEIPGKAAFVYTQNAL